MLSLFLSLFNHLDAVDAATVNSANEELKKLQRQLEEEGAKLQMQKVQFELIKVQKEREELEEKCKEMNEVKISKKKAAEEEDEKNIGKVTYNSFNNFFEKI